MEDNKNLIIEWEKSRIAYDDNREQNMFFEWELQMLDDVSKLVNKMVELEKLRFNSSRPRRLFSVAYEKKFRRYVSREIIYNYRMKHTLDILSQASLDVDKFKSSTLYKSPYTDLMLEHIQGIIDGYDLNIINTWDNFDEDRIIHFDIRKRSLNGNPLDISKMQCSLVDNRLIIKYEDLVYEYRKDEHCLIYLNDKIVMPHEKVRTKEEEEQLKKSWDKYLKEVEAQSKWDEAQRNKARILSWELAGKKYSD